MLKVKTKIGPSTIEGTGLFAAEFIAAGTVVWEFTPGFDRALTSGEVGAMPPEARAFLSTYAYKSKSTGFYIVSEDHARFFNHSDTPNTRSSHEPGSPEVVTRAVCDIAPGTELTDDYGSFENERDEENVLET